MLGIAPAVVEGIIVRRQMFGTIVLIGIALAGLLFGGGAARAPMMNLPATLSAPSGMLPQAVYRSGPTTVTAYRAAITHPDILASVPCLCGCQQSLGHRNNLDCYIAGTEAHGVVEYATHGIDCGVCQTITQLALDGARRGLSGPELRQLVLDHYGVQL